MLAEKIIEQLSALFFQHSASNFDPMQLTGSAQYVNVRATRSSFRLPGTENHSANPGSEDRPGTHGAGLQSDGQGASGQSPPVPMLFHGLPDREDFRVRRGVKVCFPAVRGRGEFAAVGVEKHGTDGDVRGGRLLCDVHRPAHHRFEFGKH